MQFNTMKKRERGSVIVEYAVVTSAMIILLFVPVPGIGESIIDIVLSAIRAFQAHTTMMLSMP